MRLDLMNPKLKHHGLGTAILSNGSFEMLEAAVRNSSLEEFLDGVYSVDTISLFKPNPQVYQLAVDQLDCDPKEILFFSSNGIWKIINIAKH